MSDQEDHSNGNLVRASSSDLATIASVNPLVSRGIADLAQMRESPPAENLPMADSQQNNLHPSSAKLIASVRRRAAHFGRQAKRLRQLQSHLQGGWPVSELDLSKRTRMCLDRLGISSLDDLTSRTADELLESKNFGMTCLTEVRVKLRELGLVLRGD